MKKIIIMIVAVMAISAQTQAQSLLNTLKKVATEAVDKASGGKLTAVAINGTWSYAAPAVRLGGDSTLSDLSGSAIGATLGSKMQGIFEKIGVKKGFCSITFNSDGSFSMPVKGKSISGTYTFDPETHAVKLSIGSIGAINGYAYISGSQLQLVFSIEKFTKLIVGLGSKVSALSTITSLLQQYENAYLGFEFAK